MTESADDWNAHWDRYAAAASENPAQRMRHRMIVRWLEGVGDAAPRVFDIGCGQGDLLAKISGALPSAELLGVELSARGVEIARSKVARGTLVAGDLLRAPAELAKFEGWATHAVCSEVLEHLDDPAAFLRAARVYLRPGAQLLVTVPGGPMSAFDKHIGHRRHFDRGSVREAMEAGGFEVDRVQGAGFPFFNLYRMLVIARGRKLAQDVEGKRGELSPGAKLVMRAFGVLFRLNLPDSSFGWQIVAIGRTQ